MSKTYRQTWKNLLIFLERRGPNRVASLILSSTISLLLQEPRFISLGTQCLLGDDIKNALILARLQACTVALDKHPQLLNLKEIEYVLGPPISVLVQRKCAQIELMNLVEYLSRMNDEVFDIWKLHFLSTLAFSVSFHLTTSMFIVFYSIITLIFFSGTEGDGERQVCSSFLSRASASELSYSQCQQASPSDTTQHTQSIYHSRAR